MNWTTARPVLKTCHINSRRRGGNVIEDFVTGDEYRHVPTGTLAILAQRLGKVFASASTWRRLVKVHKWRRTRQRVHPAKPKVGIRAMKVQRDLAH